MAAGQMCRGYSPYAALVDPELAASPCRQFRLALLGRRSQLHTNTALTAIWAVENTPRMDGFTVTNEEWVFPFPDIAATPRYGNLQQALTYALDQLELNGKVALEITPVKL